MENTIHEDVNNEYQNNLISKNIIIKRIEKVIKLVMEKKLPDTVVNRLNSSLQSIVYCAPESLYYKCQRYANICYENQNIFDEYGITETIKEIMQGQSIITTCTQP